MQFNSITHEICSLPRAATTPVYTVLLVDDEPANRQLLRDQLEVRGYVIHEADNGHQALQLVAECPPDLVLLDIMIPGIDGFEVCRRMKKDPSTAMIPVLMVTALSERQERLIGVEAGANDFLTKPVDVQELMLRVGNAIYTKSLYDQLQVAQQKAEAMLLNILPQPIIERIKNGESTIADLHPAATILVAGLVGFSTLLEQIRPPEIVGLLNEIFCAFDLLTEQHGLQKIKTVGDSYIVAGGIHSTASNHTKAIAALALRMQESLQSLNQQYGTSFCIRMGISTGPLVCGIIGRHKIAFDVWGEAMNDAYGIESIALPGSTLVDEPTYERLKHTYRFSGLRTVELKGRTCKTVRTMAPWELNRDRLEPEVALSDSSERSTCP